MFYQHNFDRDKNWRVQQVPCKGSKIDGEKDYLFYNLNFSII